MKEIKGIIVSLPSPFTSDNTLDENGLRSNLQFLIENKVHSVAPVTTTGEFWALSDYEYNRIIEIVVDEVNEEIPVIAGVGSNYTPKAIEFASSAKNAGADAIFVVPPYYNRPTQDGIFRHFESILNAVDIPTIIYNEPLRSAVNMSVETILRLYEEYDNIIGLKESNFEQIHQDIALTEGKLPVFVVDLVFLPSLILGGAGVVSVVANIAPKKLVQLYENYMNNKIAEARELHYFLLPLLEGGALFLETNPGPLKEAMNFMGLSAGNPRLPLVKMNEENKVKLKTILEKLNYI
jgi:4-hydroxy-tetrahydrodipicolinate synthase